MEVTDSELMTRVCGGDGDAFESIVDRYKDPLINYLTHILRSHDQAEEVAQESFVRLFRNAERYRELEKIGPYLFRIATNHAISDMRRRKRWNLLVPRFAAGQARHAPPADAGLLTGETQRKVAEALAALPLMFRAPLALYEIEEWSYEDIAQALGCRLGTVKSRIARARGLMRRQLAGWWIGETDERFRNRERVETAPAPERVASLHL